MPLPAEEINLWRRNEPWVLLDGISLPRKLKSFVERKPASKVTSQQH